MHTISKQFAFSASHTLNGLADGHPCSRLHGHNYVVVIELAADFLDSKGMVFDYNDLAPFAEYLDTFDHRHLNDLIEVNPTAENLAWIFANKAVFLFGGRVSAVTVSETPKTTARCAL